MVADVASRLFGAEVTPERVIGETLQRATTDTAPAPDALRAAIAAATRPGAEAEQRSFEDLAADPLAVWVEDAFGLDTEPDTGRPIRRTPTTVPVAARALAAPTGTSEAECAAAIRGVLMAGSQARIPATGRPLFA